MKHRYRFVRKSYAMTRMASAIERAIDAVTLKEKDRAARWAAAWGLLCGIKTRPVNLKRSEIGLLPTDKAAETVLTPMEFPEIDFTASEAGQAQLAATAPAQPPLSGAPASHA